MLGGNGGVVQIAEATGGILAGMVSIGCNDAALYKLEADEDPIPDQAWLDFGVVSVGDAAAACLPLRPLRALLEVLRSEDDEGAERSLRRLDSYFFLSAARTPEL